MKKYFWTIIYKLGGANYSIIQHCPPENSKQYRHLGYAVIICTGIAAISGAEMAYQYTSSITIIALVSLLFAGIIFSFDYFINNSNSNKVAPKLFRVPVALASVFIGSASLMVMINQTEIDNKLNSQKTAAITTGDSIYQADKSDRYKLYKEKKDTVENYHKTVCLPEAKLGYAGVNYMRKDAYCLTQDSILTIEKAQLDSAEVQFYNSYLIKRAASCDIKNNSFPKKCVMLPEVFKENWFTMLLAIAAIIIAFYVECQNLIMKFSLNDDDEYKKARAEHNRLCTLKTNENLKNMVEHANKMSDLKLTQKNAEAIKALLDDRLEIIDDNAIMFYQLSERERIYRESGLYESANQVASLRRKITTDENVEKWLEGVLKNANKN